MSVFKILGSVMLLACLGCPRQPDPPTPRIRFVLPGPGDVAAQVMEQALRAHQERRQLLLYVGAPWCEPCQRFHAAAQRGELDGVLPPLLLLEFNADVDNPRLKEAGYASRMIPLLAVPGPDGRASGRQLEGSIKGEGAVANLTPRLQTLLQAMPPP